MILIEFERGLPASQSGTDEITGSSLPLWSSTAAFLAFDGFDGSGVLSHDGLAKALGRRRPLDHSCFTRGHAPCRWEQLNHLIKTGYEQALLTERPSTYSSPPVGRLGPSRWAEVAGRLS
jgi:hypothetical protein